MFKRVLVAIDTSDYSRLIVPAAVEISRKFMSRVTVLHVVEHDRGRSVTYATEGAPQATRLVGASIKAFHEAGLEVRGEVHDVAAGHVARDIVETAATLESDLIIMGSRGLSDVQGLLLGSVTHKVMHLVRIPVLVVQGPIPAPEKVERVAMVTSALAMA